MKNKNKYIIETIHGNENDTHSITIKNLQLKNLTSVELWQILKIIEKN